MNLDTQLLILISVMIALGLFGMYQWRKLLMFIYDKWLPALDKEVTKELQEQQRKAMFEMEAEAEHQRQGGGDIGGRYGGGSTYSE